MIRCKLCGETSTRGVEDFMGHLLYKHREEFIERCERLFFEPANDRTEEIWNSLNESERHGVRFGLFPTRVGELTKAEVLGLMRKANEVYGEL